MTETEKLHNVINTLEENAVRIAAIGKLSDDLLSSQAQLSTGISHLTDGLDQIGLNQKKLIQDVEAITNMERSICRDITDVHNSQLSLVVSQREESTKTVAAMKSQFEALNNLISFNNVNTMNEIKKFRHLIVVCSLAIISVIVISHFL